MSTKLQTFLSKLTGKPVPQYKIDYAQGEGGAVYRGIPVKISGTFEYDIFTNGLVTFGIYDSIGHAVEMFFTDVPRNQGHYLFNYEFCTSGLTRENYFAHLRLDGQVKKEQKFTF